MALWSKLFSITSRRASTLERQVRQRSEIQADRIMPSAPPPAAMPIKRADSQKAVPAGAMAAVNLQELIQKLNHYNQGDAVAAASELGKINDPRALSALTQRLRDGIGPPSVVFEAILRSLDKLGYLRHPRAVELCAFELHNRNPVNPFVVEILNKVEIDRESFASLSETERRELIRYPQRQRYLSDRACFSALSFATEYASLREDAFKSLLNRCKDVSAR